VKIQAHVRGHQARQKVEDEKEKIVKIQAHVRGNQTREQLKKDQNLLADFKEDEEKIVKI
jgi:hypothetical protein